ncbi:phage integrase SAM-like domain-containing protein [Spirosoma rigui]|uniref:phage integrase SAM-like domain-containing protein n=1 Tax=Spirosoma rigui TaxID=564064 RepID=UPI0009AF43A2|nr:phage integrase SAM-like domain-containing protein [Spirosoma rigui]
MRVLFKLRRNKRNPNKQAIIYCRIKLDGIHANDFSTDVKVMPSEWDSKNQKITGGSLEVYDNNLKLSQIRSDITRFFLQHQATHKNLSAQGLADFYTGKYKVNYTFKELVDLFKADVEINYDSKGTRKNYATRLANIDLFLEEKNLHHLPADRFTLGRADEFVRWAKARNLDHEYIIRHTQILKNITEDAVRREILELDPLAVFKLKKRGKVNTKHLEVHEIDSIATYKWRKNLQRIADLFVFSVYTGLHYEDAQTLTADQVRAGIDGRIWIIKPRGKYADSKFFTGEMVQVVPLHPRATAIIEKYSTAEGFQGLPKISNSGYNLYLKEIQFILDIKLKLTVRIARKTFTDVMLNELGVSEEAVAAMLGHNTTRHVKHYGRANERRVAKEVKFH